MEWIIAVIAILAISILVQLFKDKDVADSVKHKEPTPKPNTDDPKPQSNKSSHVSHVSTISEFDQGQRLIYGIGCEQHVTTGFRLIRSAAENGDPRALFVLGEVHEIGKFGNAVNISLALEYYEKAKKAGNFAAHGKIVSLLPLLLPTHISNQHKKMVYDVVMFPITGAIAVCDPKLQIPGSGQIYAYSAIQNLMRTIDLGSWHSAVTIADERYFHAVDQYLAWCEKEGKHDNNYQSRIHGVAPKIEPNRLSKYSPVSYPTLYHFTDTRNLPSIRQKGLLSWYNLNLKHIRHIPSSNQLSRDLDLSKDLQDYVRLCLQPSHPMAYIVKRDNRIQNLAWLAVSSEVLEYSSALFSNKNATANDAKIGSNPETAFKSSNSQAEVLIKGEIDPQWIDFPDY